MRWEEEMRLADRNRKEKRRREWERADKEEAGRKDTRQDARGHHAGISSLSRASEELCFRRSPGE